MILDGQGHGGRNHGRDFKQSASLNGARDSILTPNWSTVLLRESLTNNERSGIFMLEDATRWLGIPARFVLGVVKCAMGLQIARGIHVKVVKWIEVDECMGVYQGKVSWRER